MLTLVLAVNKNSPLTRCIISNFPAGPGTPYISYRFIVSINKNLFVGPPSTPSQNGSDNSKKLQESNIVHTFRLRPHNGHPPISIDCTKAKRGSVSKKLEGV